MISIRKILGLISVLSCALLPGKAVLFAQDQNAQNPSASSAQAEGPSTADLESQPNTALYPAAVVRRAPAQFGPGMAVRLPNSQPAVSPAAAPVKALVNSSPEDTRTVSQNFSLLGQTLIGPPSPVPPTPEKMPPVPPKVSYENGLLSVESVNARLTDVLNAIRTKAGVEFEGMPNTQDRVGGKFGPAPVNEVLTTLFQGLRFDYVILSSPENPFLVKRVIVSPNSGAVAATPAAQPARQNGNEDEEEAAAEDAEAEQPQPGPGAAPRSTEQLLNELKQLQEQQNQAAQQQQQQQPPPNTAPPLP
jgi:hypothetical protein